MTNSTSVKNYYYTDAISDNAAIYINDHYQTHPADPFFLYVSYTSAHWPMHAFEKDIKKYKGIYDDGYDPIREQRFAKAKKLGVIQPQWELRSRSVGLGEIPSQTVGHPVHGGVRRDGRPYGSGDRSYC